MNRVRVKICGMTTPDDISAASEAGADAVGLNFYAQSPRYVSPQRAIDLLRGFPPLLDAVGVFVGLKTRHVCAIAFQLGLGGVQCFADHDDLDDPFPFRRIAAFRVKDADSLKAIDQYLNACQAVNRMPAAILVDAHVDGQLGGTGHTAPWNLLANHRPPVPLILAGGLTPENVAEAIRVVRPFGVDVASGVESAPGRKDADKVRRFIDAVRSASE